MKGALLGRNFTFCCQAKMSNKGCSAASLTLAVRNKWKEMMSQRYCNLFLSCAVFGSRTPTTSNSSGLWTKSATAVAHHTLN